MLLPLRVLIVCGLLATSALVNGGVGGTQELPPGFTDGRPVGEEAGTPALAPAPEAATKRYFGQEAYADVRTSVSATARSCTLSDDTLTALVLAPVFKESSAATTAATAPAPMTLSRYDEWSGTFGEDTNSNANYGLYAFRDPYTDYQRAYWHPGIGIWQYDSAGLGAPLTAVESMHVAIVSADVARIMSGRYCAATGTDLDKRYAAWTDWGFPCTLCEGFYQEMVSTTPDFANLELVPGITSLGGTVAHSCLLTGVASPVTCFYVNPSVGVIQGATAWATYLPDGGSGPTVPPAPLSKPFYMVDRGATEERYWLRDDTGYGVDVKAVRTVGKNARPRSNQAGSGLTWSFSSTLCDLTASRGACVPVPPTGVSSATVSVTSSNRPYPLDANGDGIEDVLWYAPGPAADLLWLGNGSGSFSAAPASIIGTYDDVLPGDVDGDGDDDVVVYQRATGSTYLLRSKGDGTFSLSAWSMGVGRWPFLLDSNGDGDQEVFWYGVDSVPDSIWSWVGTGFSASPRVVPGTFTPFVGDFDGNKSDDIFWYAPGPTVDKVWLHGASGGYTSLARPVSGTYRWSAGDVDGDGKDDIVWYAPGDAPDFVWYGAPNADFAGQPLSILGDYTPILTTVEATGRDSLVLYAPGTSNDYWYRWSATRQPSLSTLYLPGTQTAVEGRFSTGGADGLLWYEAGVDPDVVWYR